MESHIHEWVNLLIRWIHFIVGVAWIGASFYFNWLENNLDRESPQRDGIAGNLWAIHGGGFYHLNKFAGAPSVLPSKLHWFKWEAYATWLSGFALLVVVYYFNARLFLIEPSRADLTPEKGIVLGVVAVLGSWFVYDVLCRLLRQWHALLAVSVLAYLLLLAWMLSEIFNGRAAYIHVGAAIGTIMVGNVFFVIIPAQKQMVSTLSMRSRLEPKYAANGLLRSRHNNYLTLPVLFIMISVHFPSTYGHNWNWVVLGLVSVAGWLVRHYFNVRHASRAGGLLALALLLMLGLAWITMPPSKPLATAERIETTRIASIIEARCSGCHAKTPTQPGFTTAPTGLILESQDVIELNAARIFSTTATKSMPIGNITGMTDAERALIAAWYHGLTTSD